MAQRDAVPMNGSDRIMIRGAPLWAGDAEWMVGKPRKHLAPDLDKDFLMDGTRYRLSSVFQQPFANESRSVTRRPPPRLPA